MNITYNIHNKIKVGINNVSHHLIKDLNLRYHYFEDNDVTDLDIQVTIGEFTPNLKDCFCLDRKFYIKKNYIYLCDSDKGLNWETEIWNIEEKTIQINFNPNRGNYFHFPWCLFPDLVMELYILQPILEWKLALKGCLLTHSGAVCKNGQAMLVMGRGGSRKTQIVMELLKKGFGFTQKATFPLK